MKNSVSEISKKLKKADVLKYYNRFQSVLGKQLHKGLIEAFIRTTVKGLSYFLNFDNTEELSKDLQNDELVKGELSLISGQLVLRGGRFVALGSGLFHIIKHIDFSTKEPKSAIENYQGADEQHTTSHLERRKFQENFKRCYQTANRLLTDCSTKFQQNHNRITTKLNRCQHLSAFILKLLLKLIEEKI